MTKIDIPTADSKQHELSHFDKAELTPELANNNPFELFASWYSDATLCEPSDANAMSLATVDKNSMPNIRIVLLKGFSESGFVFFTNYLSQKGRELESNQNAALCFHWKSLLRQVRIRGIVEKVSASDSDEYFLTRDKNSQIGAWVSKQSEPVLGREQLLSDLKQKQSDFSNQVHIQRPPHWGGYCLKPLEIEFWQNGAFRLHDRLVFSRDDVRQARWQNKKLYP